ncbi:unnamed protein product [Phyllotreta striolata]|uniref:VPS37 C-terminal domain-containing protein n=1 Tax=Phyllotreta striolata TaxID=444603 RepID=A0A9N9XNJ7_PHYSR|nr:unnamed protein product [Phyllotreta striolata]
MLSRRFMLDGDIRKHQINTLKIFNDNVVEIVEGEEYDISFNSGVNNLCLKISLGNKFPKEKPHLKIVPTVSHPWVTADGDVTSAPGLLNFTVHSDLGRVVQAIIREFQRTPPPLALKQSTTISPSVPINGEIRASPINYQPFPNIKSFSPPSQIGQTSHQSAALPELSNLSIEELQFLNDNTDRQDEFISELPLIREQNKILDDVILQVEEMAVTNLSKAGKLDELKLDIEQRMETIAKLAFENERLYSIYQQLSDKYAPRKIQDELKVAAERADKESEKVAESFLSGEIDVDKFLIDFIKIKAISQNRKTKEEKLGQQLDRLEKAGF